MPDRIILETSDHGKSEFDEALHIVINYLKKDEKLKELLKSYLSSCVHDACLTYLWKHDLEQLSKDDLVEVSDNSAKEFINLLLM